jgi:hypothetical protein
MVSAEVYFVCICACFSIGVFTTCIVEELYVRYLCMACADLAAVGVIFHLWGIH